MKEEEKQIEHIKATFNSKANAEVQDKKRKELKDKVPGAPDASQWPLRSSVTLQYTEARVQN